MLIRTNGLKLSEIIKLSKWFIRTCCPGNNPITKHGSVNRRDSRWKIFHLEIFGTKNLFDITKFKMADMKPDVRILSIGNGFPSSRWNGNDCQPTRFDPLFKP